MCAGATFRNNSGLSAGRHLSQILQSFRQVIHVSSLCRSQVFQKSRYGSETADVSIIRDLAALEEVMRDRIDIGRPQHVNLLKSRSNVEAILLQMDQMRARVNPFK